MCERVKTRHMGPRTALPHGSVLHAGVQGTEVCSTPRWMEVRSTPSCGTPRAAPEWKCAPHSAAIGVVWLKVGLTVGGRDFLEFVVEGNLGAALGR